MTQDSSEKKTYTGGCHCRSNIYEFKCPPLDSPKAELHYCNCSYCKYDTGVSIAVPSSDFRFLKGSMENMTGYFFANKRIGQYFCKTCGVTILAHFDKMDEYIVGLRCVDDFELTDEIAKRAKLYDGKSVAIKT
ncbi:hypothetical protein BT69DRAFT_1279808 [Atractiella rhizophila]|nr:hypothetical protein BT69DRAFT_1279808 [Atractiella rhizophila]